MKDVLKSFSILFSAIFIVLLVQDIIQYRLYEGVLYRLIMGMLICAAGSIIGSAFGLRNNRLLEDASYMAAMIGLVMYIICLGVLLYRVLTTPRSLVHIIGFGISVIIYKRL